MNKMLKKYGIIIFSTLLIVIYFINPSEIFVSGNELSFFSIIFSCLTIEFFIRKAKSGEEIYMRPIAAMKAMEEAVGMLKYIKARYGHPDTAWRLYGTRHEGY